MFNSSRFSLNLKPGINTPRLKPSLISTVGKNLQSKLNEDEEFYRIMESIKTEKTDTFDYQLQAVQLPKDAAHEGEDISRISLIMLMIVLLTSKIIQSFHSMLIKVKNLFDQLFPYIWSWMKSITRGTYRVNDRKVFLLILCVPVLTLVLFVYCSLLILNALTEFLLSNAPSYLTQVIVTKQFNKLLTLPNLKL